MFGQGHWPRRSRTTEAVRQEVPDRPDLSGLQIESSPTGARGDLRDADLVTDHPARTVRIAVIILVVLALGSSASALRSNRTSPVSATTRQASQLTVGGRGAERLASWCAPPEQPWRSCAPRAPSRTIANSRTAKNKRLIDKSTNLLGGYA